ncbi:hypothetical protein ASC97_07295 [Rhizobium sp. Root1203]|uniref:Lar family restriction alleviation protein n=1 Tax=Rhizobium sp. Root1203 TaxID=1736427 RepID=UPI00070E5009|nr:hypothetical protein ASC97_07295 [Rhizobium sp. Root1203]
MTDAAGLKPCPFCGGEKIRDGYIRDGRRIYCADCSASVTAFQPEASNRAAALWNCRPAELAYYCTISDKLSRVLQTVTNDDTSVAGSKERERFVERTNLLVECMGSDATSTHVVEGDEVLKNLGLTTTTLRGKVAATGGTDVSLPNHRQRVSNMGWHRSSFRRDDLSRLHVHWFWGFVLRTGRHRLSAEATTSEIGDAMALGVRLPSAAKAHRRVGDGPLGQYRNNKPDDQPSAGLNVPSSARTVVAAPVDDSGGKRG